MSAYYTTSGPARATEQSTLAPVLVAVAGPAPQSRLTVLVRIFMVIPQLFVLGLLGIAAMVVVIIGWFCALFTGRLPVFAADFLTGYLRWLARVYAYAILLTDVYPPFSLDDASYPVRVSVMPGPLNRLAVLFRIFLLIPCWIVAVVVVNGAFTVFQLVSWLIVLINGQMPDTIHQALTAVLRYYIRTLGFALMLTSAYPAGLFGDPGVPGPWSPAGPPTEYGTGGGLSWRLILSAAAHKLVVGFLAIGVLISVTGWAVDAAIVGNSVSALTAAEEVTTDIQPVRTILDSYSTSVQSCHGQLNCVTSLDRKVAAALNTFAGQLRAVQMPSHAVAANAALATAVSNSASIFARLGAATSANQYISEAQAANLQGSVDAINQAYSNLGTALSS